MPETFYCILSDTFQSVFKTQVISGAPLIMSFHLRIGKEFI